MTQRTPDFGLPTATPESQGVPSAAIEAALRRIEAGGHDPRAVAIARHGRLLAVGAWAPFTLEQAMLVYSMSKTFTACAAGIAVGEGLLRLDETMADIFPEQAAHAPEASRRFRLRDALAMATGHELDTADDLFRAHHEGADAVAALLAVPPERAPGTHFTYNQGATFLVSAAVQARSGERVVDYLRPRLFDPLGIGERWWIETARATQGFSGLHATVTDALALGQLLLADGVWDGQRLLPEGWVADLSAEHVSIRGDGSGDGDGSGAGDWEQGYGYQVWRSSHGYRADGAFGQLVLVLPQEDLVIVHLGSTLGTHEVLAAYWEELLPALADGPLEPDGALGIDEAESLRGYLAGLTADVVLPGGDADAPQARIAVVATSDGWLVTLDGAEVAVGREEWVRTTVELGEVEDVGGPAVAHLAASGRENADGSWEASVLLLDAPHRLQLRAEPGASEAMAWWRTMPFGDPRRLHAVPAPRT